ncbi:MRP-S23 domain containing protein [Trichuris trichiura]|uniref:Small ribosomal subunit protein mS23 n=1 Tax=Trichuris trichiura TaxID=36087 RepID=A0A077ZLE2_TRITR|nr:MRP-S23 domain containing protein [Trichuris trichiura]
MCESRVEKVGSIFSRLNGLIKSGAMKHADRPVWYDVYAAFPPKYEPHYDRPAALAPNFREIFYPEDFVRGRFFKEFGNIGRINLLTDQGSSLSEKFVAKFFELCPDREKSHNYEQVFANTVDALSSEGVVLKKVKDQKHQ